jgi:hypothetical protein
MNARNTLFAALAIASTIAVSATPTQAANGQNAAFFGGLAAGVVGGLAISAIATPRPVYATPVYSGSCYIARRPVTNGWGDVIGYRNVRVCD